MRLRDISIRNVLMGAFLVTGVLPFAILGILSLTKASSSLSHQATSQLTAVRDIKKHQIESYFRTANADLNALVANISSIKKNAADKLIAVRKTKEQAIKRHFDTIKNQVTTLAQDKMVIDAMRDFNTAFASFRADNHYAAPEIASMRTHLGNYYVEQFGKMYERETNTAPKINDILNEIDDDTIALQYEYISNNINKLGQKHQLTRAKDASRYSTLHSEYHPALRGYLNAFEFYDIFLVDAQTGRIVYTVFKELDFATSLKTGPYAQSGLGKVFAAAQELGPDESTIVDYSQYFPSYEAPASFIACPIFEKNKRIGVLIFQLSIDRLNAIMHEREGLGETGETYLVGQDFLMRSDSFKNPELRTVKASFANPDKGKVKTTAVLKALDGEPDTDVISNADGQQVLSSWTSLIIGDLIWALVAEVNVSEMFVPMTMNGQEYYKNYVQDYGYSDLLLFNPDGSCYYSVTRGKELNSNLLTGAHANTSLGAVVRQAIQTPKAVASDFTPYALRDNEPYAFLGQAIVHEGQPEAVVVLQMSTSRINEIMTERSGMGQTGETFLVGSDKLMRSDSVLDPHHRSVRASFGDPKTGSAESSSSTKALQGETGEHLISNHRGETVLSAYAPLAIPGLNWAIMAEIDAAEALGAVGSLRWNMLFIAAIAIPAIIVLAVIITRSITSPLRQGVEFAQSLSEGNFSAHLKIEQRNETGILAKALNTMVGSVGQMIRETIQSIQALLDTSATLSNVSHELEVGASETSERAANSASAAEEMSSSMTSMAAAVDQAATNLGTVAAAAEEMSATIKEIAQNAERARSITESAHSRVAATTDRVKELGTAASQIGKVTESINDIAEQTNLLALNATIEAARAGDAGRGFAVVANEIKQLAMEAAGSAHDIKERIASIQQSASTTVNDIGLINTTFLDVTAMVSTIAAAVEEQSVTTHDIANNVNQASQGVQHIAHNVTQTTEVATEIATEIAAISLATKNIDANSHKVAGQAQTLSQLSAALRQLVNRFTI